MRMKWPGFAAAILVAALLAFAGGYLAGQRPIAGQAQISRMSAPEPVVPTAARQGLIDVNSATAAELADIPGVGPVIAGRIVEYRERGGPLSGPEELLNIKGIGEKALEKMRDYITFGGADENTGG